MTYDCYKVFHLLGVFMVLTPLAAITLHVILGGVRDHGWRRPIALIHGFGMLITAFTGWRLQPEGTWPGWIWGKLVIWLLLGLMIGVVYRLQSKAKILWWVILILPTIAAYLAIFKP